MSQDLLSLVLARLNMKPAVLSASELHKGLKEMAAAWEAAGIIRPSAAAASLACAECGRLCRIQIELDANKKPHGYLSCPECGIAEVDLGSLSRWAIDVEKLIAFVFQGSGANVAVSELVPQRLWRICKAAWLGRTRELLFTFCRRRDDGDAVLQVVRKRPKSVLFVPTESNVIQWSKEVPNRLVAVDSVASIQDATIAFDREFMEAQLIDADTTAPTAKRRSRMRRSQRPGKTELLERELISHLKAARDHAFWTKEETGTPELLPRPTQKELGVRIGIAEWDVSRCLNHPAARELQLYWETAADLDRILGWNGAVGRSGIRSVKRKERRPCQPAKGSGTRT